jgi:hypothetical protein
VKRQLDEEVPTVVDHYIPTSIGDLSHPNATLGVAITGDSPKYRVEEESFFVTTEINPFKLKVGENKEILRLKEAGEVCSIEIISDNPFLQVHLELDDYRADEKGITAAELLQYGRTTFADMEFSAKKLPSGDYSLVYAPRINTAYSDVFKLKVANRLTNPSRLAGTGSFIEPLGIPLQLRGGLPKLSKRSYLGGTYIDIPQLESVPQHSDEGITSIDISNALSRALDWELYDNQFNNETSLSNEADFRFNADARESDKAAMTSINPYTGNAGRLDFSMPSPINPGVFARIVFFPKGEVASTTSGAPTADSNMQHIAIYAGTSLTASTEAEAGLLTIFAASFEFEPIYVRDRGRVYFPGTVLSIFQHKSSTGTFVTDGSGNGAYILLISGGLDFVPEKVGISSSVAGVYTGLNTFLPVGLDHEYNDNGMIVRKIIVKRKRKRSLV